MSLLINILSLLPTISSGARATTNYEDLILKAKWTRHLTALGSKARVSFSKTPKEWRNFLIGDYSYSTSPIDIYHTANCDKISIGRFTSLGRNLKIISVGQHNPKFISAFSFSFLNTVSTGDVEIGNDVWIGDDVTIMGGVRIGDGAVIGTKSLVTKDVDAFTITAGIPARSIRKIFDQQMIEELMSISWWNYDLETLTSLKEKFTEETTLEKIRHLAIALRKVEQNRLKRGEL